MATVEILRVRITSAIRAQLEKETQHRGKTMSGIVRDALDHYFNSETLLISRYVGEKNDQNGNESTRTLPQ